MLYDRVFINADYDHLGIALENYVTTRSNIKIIATKTIYFDPLDIEGTSSDAEVLICVFHLNMVLFLHTAQTTHSFSSITTPQIYNTFLNETIIIGAIHTE